MRAEVLSPLRWGAAFLLVGVAAVACAPAHVAQTPSPLPPLPVEPMMPGPGAARPLPPDPLAGREPGRNVTLAAVDVDVRALLPALAEAADLSLVMGPEVQGRVTVNLVDVPALEAMRLVLEAAGLMIAPPPLTSPWGPAVFYAIPINIDTAHRDLIRTRFRVSEELTDWLLANRLR